MVIKRRTAYHEPLEELKSIISSKGIRRQSFFSKEGKVQNALAMIPEEEHEQLKEMVERNHRSYSSRVQLKAAARQEEWNKYNQQMDDYNKMVNPFTEE